VADKIKVKNIYYMLSYAYQTLQETGFNSVASEDFENIHDLFASILIHGIGSQIKRGLHRDYIMQEEVLSGLRGQIRITESIKQQTLIQRKLVCTFDEFTENTSHNQILKCTMLLLLRKGNVKIENKKSLRKLLLYFNNVDDIEPPFIHWDSLKYHRNNAAYRMLVNFCSLVIKGMLLTTEKGDYRLSEWIDDEQMHRLYEKFVLAYYQKKNPEYSPKAAYIDWDLTDGVDKEFLPAMKSDIILSKGNRTLIIDTKWYESGTMQTRSQYGSTDFRSNHLYQIFAYVKNKDKGATGNVAGVLLYAKTDELITPNHDFCFSGNQISLKTLDLNSDWNTITAQLDNLCSWLEAV